MAQVEQTGLTGTHERSDRSGHCSQFDLLDFHKEKLDGQEFLDVSEVLQKALANESRAKEARNL